MICKQCQQKKEKVEWRRMQSSIARDGREAGSLDRGTEGAQNARVTRCSAQNFLQWHQFSLQCRTTVKQRLLQDLVPNVTGFIMVTRKLRYLKKYPLSHIGNMDETPLWFDMPGETTITCTGQRSVPVCTTGNGKSSYTVVLSVMADSRKLKPFVVFKGVRPVAELHNVSGMIVAYSKNG